MGTNYYARILPNKKKKEYLKKLIDDDKFDKIQETVQEMYGDSGEYENGAVIHLGKRSGGWKFLFNPNYERYYPLTKKGLLEFLQRDDVIIYSEYFSEDNGVYEYTDDPDDTSNDKEYLWTPEQFMDMALNWGKEDGYCLETYYAKDHNGLPSYILEDPFKSYWIKKGYNPKYHEFFNDDMRWSTCCEFS